MNYGRKYLHRQQEQGIGTKLRLKLAAKLLIIVLRLMKKKEKIFDLVYLLV
jgi:hypothetical protein